MDFSIELDFSSLANWVTCNGLLMPDGSAFSLLSQLRHEGGCLQSPINVCEGSCLGGAAHLSVLCLVSQTWATGCL